MLVICPFLGSWFVGLCLFCVTEFLFRPSILVILSTDFELCVNESILPAKHVLSAGKNYRKYVPEKIQFTNRRL